MGSMTAEETREFTRTVRDVVGRDWGRASAAATADLRKLWDSVILHGWFDLAAEDAVDAALAVARETGRAACPLPVMDAFVAARLLADRPDLRGDIADGTMRVIVAVAGPGDERRSVRHAEAGDAAGRVLVLPADGGRVSLHPVERAVRTEGLAAPAWSDLLLGPAEAEFTVAAEPADEAVVLLRLGMAVRAMAAAERAHETAVEHAKIRRQFGRAIGAFGAVQQRTARCQIDVGAADLLIADAAARYGAGAPDWTLAAELATTHVAATATRVQFGAHHTLAAIGYYEEHDAPWLFRRVHADVTRLRAVARTRGEVADVLIETGAGLPVPDLGPSAAGFRTELRTFLDARTPPDHPTAGLDDDPELVAAMAERGWLGMAWPAEAGGRRAPLAEQLVLQQEIIYRRLPVSRALATVAAVGTALVRHGSAEQKERFLPRIRQGIFTVCLGYSEPEAGSDLGSLKTAAARDGDGWVINGQKLWTTNAHRTEYVWLAVRTDPRAAPPYAGISMFLVPTDTPGITVQQHRALSGETSCSVFLDDVRVPDTARVGKVNGGWEVITEALAGERVMLASIAATLHRQLDDLLAVVRSDAAALAGPRGSAERARLSGLAAAVQATRHLASAVGRVPAGPRTRLATPMAGVMGSELAEEFGEAALEILGPAAALGEGVTGVPGGGGFEQGLRTALTYVIGGGTNDVQRGLIARGLGLPW